MRARTTLCAAGLLLSGCASLDPRPDQHRAESLVSERTRIATPWTDIDPHTIWDGRADLTADAAVRVALATNLDIQGALSRIAAARADLVQSGLLPNPVLNLSLGFPLTAGDGTVSVGAGVVQNLAWLMQSSGRKSAATSDLDAEVLATSDLALRTVAEVRALHAKLVLAQSAESDRAAGVEQAQHALDLAKRSAVAGTGSSLEVHRRELRLIELHADAAHATAELAVLKRLMLERLGDAAASAEWSVAQTEPLPALRDDLTEDAVIKLVWNQRLDVAASKARYFAARARTGLSKTEIWSDLSAGADYERDNDKRDALGPSVSVPIPIFDTGAARNAKADAEALRAHLESMSIWNRANAEARSAFVRADAARRALAESEPVLLAAADRNLDLSRRAFAAGTLELTALLDAEEQVLTAHLRLSGLREAAALSAIELERAVGGLLDQSPPPP